MPSAVIVNQQGRSFIDKQTKLIWKDDKNPSLNGSCANLVQYFGCGATSSWTQGAIVKGNPNVKAGTCIATFFGGNPAKRIAGKYPNKSSGNSCMVFVSQDEGGITAYHQAANWNKPGLYFHEFKDDMSDPSFNGNCYSVILTSNPYKAAPGFKYSSLVSNPVTTPDMTLVLAEIKKRMKAKPDQSVIRALEKVLVDGVLTFKDLETVIKSARDKNKHGVEVNRNEMIILDCILDKAKTLDGKSKRRLQEFMKRHKKK